MEDLQEYVGLSRDEAVELAKRRLHDPIRVIEKGMMATCDYNIERFNLDIDEDDNVKCAWKG